MQLGMIGLGRMGANMVRRLQKNGHKCVVLRPQRGFREAIRGRRSSRFGFPR